MTAQSNSTETKKAAASRQLPVSIKAYNDFVGRIESSLTSIGASAEVSAAKRVIDGYLAGNTGADADAPVNVRLLFALLRPEIDKAMARSARARQRAAVRKAAQSLAVAEPETVASNEVAGVQPADSVNDREKSNPVVYNAVFGDAASAASSASSAVSKPMNRRERRELERLLRRESRRSNRENHQIRITEY